MDWDKHAGVWVLQSSPKAHASEFSGAARVGVPAEQATAIDSEPDASVPTTVLAIVAEDDGSADDGSEGADEQEGGRVEDAVPALVVPVMVTDRSMLPVVTQVEPGSAVREASLPRSSDGTPTRSPATTHTRPRGRSPRGKVWDTEGGFWKSTVE
jgi:hypothetical protein